MLILYIANYATWFGTKENVEVTFKLDGWITIGTVEENELSDLQLTYKGKLIKNVLKVSWRIVNTGAKGIEKFEYGPAIGFPNNFQIIEAKISATSPILNIDKNLMIDTVNSVITVHNLGIFNKGDFFKIEIYVMNIPTSAISGGYFDNWNLHAKSLDLKIKKDILFELPQVQKQKPFPGLSDILTLIIVIVALIFNFFQLRRRI